MPIFKVLPSMISLFYNGADSAGVISNAVFDQAFRLALHICGHPVLRMPFEMIWIGSVLWRFLELGENQM
jgi:hypothetical protein